MRCNSLVIFLIIILGLWFLPSVGEAQENKVVVYVIDTSQTVQRGDSLQVILSFTVATGWHVYAPSRANRSDGLVATQAKLTTLPQGMRLARPVTLPNVKFYQGREVYMGEGNQLIFSLLTDPNSFVGSYNLEIGFTYQACNLEQCLLPVTKKLIVRIQVGDSEP